MQQPMPMPAQAPSMTPAAGITTEQIQKFQSSLLALTPNQLGSLLTAPGYDHGANHDCLLVYLVTSEQHLDENKRLILAILENQNLGKLAECSQYQAQLQKNLLYLAAIADTQPQTSVNHPQMVPPGASPGVGGHYMSQVPMFPPRTPLTPQQMQEQQLQQQQAQLLPFAGQMMMRPGAVNGMPQPQPHHFEMPRGANPQAAASTAGRQDAGGATSEPSGTDSHRSTGAENEGGGDLADKY
ncbi:hypothetical protein GUJ93_ZPchr0012g19111 [Zizania palustris]|uniref:SS18 N-terminal domain-containing protein n=1 Tax=Zizania palustris TaxID=103762 RepID=A0A8J6BUG5_ZIZPA|nr:hypothetical protein GUJ93_ZPchr0012g19111 [Zizania palustris]